MATIQPLTAKKRDAAGTGIAKKLRRAGRVPGAVYGGKQDHYGVDVDYIAIRDLLAHSASDNVLVRLDIDGAKEQGKLALIQAVQHHPLTSAVIHVDFRVVNEDDEIIAAVPLELTGECQGVKKGGLLDQQLQSLDVRCKPADLPEKLQGDVTNLDMGHPFHVSEVTWPEGVSAVLTGDVVVAIVAEMKALISEAASEEQPLEAAEPAEAED